MQAVAAQLGSSAKTGGAEETARAAPAPTPEEGPAAPLSPPALPSAASTPEGTPGGPLVHLLHRARLRHPSALRHLFLRRFICFFASSCELLPSNASLFEPILMNK